LSSLNNVYGGMLSAMGKKVISFELYKTTTNVENMAGGKLTPRQKMINLMYLVFIAMLMNVSKEVITGFG
jgi:hypothetical protein